jgi:hypothetical protein
MLPSASRRSIAQLQSGSRRSTLRLRGHRGWLRRSGRRRSISSARQAGAGAPIGVPVIQISRPARASPPATQRAVLRRRSPTQDLSRQARDPRDGSGRRRHRMPSTRSPRRASTTRRNPGRRRHSARTSQPSRSRLVPHTGCGSSSACRPPQTKQVRRPPCWISSAIASRARSSFQLAAAHEPDPPTLQWCSHASQIGHVASWPQSWHRTVIEG